MILKTKFERKDMVFTLTKKFRVHFHWDRDEIMLWYAMGIFLFLFRNMLLFFQRAMWYKIIQNFNSLRDLVLEMLATDFALVLVFVNILWAAYTDENATKSRDGRLQPKYETKTSQPLHDYCKFDNMVRQLLIQTLGKGEQNKKGRGEKVSKIEKEPPKR